MDFNLPYSLSWCFWLKVVVENGHFFLFILELERICVDFRRNLCEKYSGLLLTENGNVFMFGSLCVYEECIIN